MLNGIQLLVIEHVNKRLTRGEKLDLPTETKRLTNIARDFIVEILEDRRNYYSSNEVGLKDKMSFVVSDFAPNKANFGPTTAEDMLELIDFVQISLYVE